MGGGTPMDMMLVDQRQSISPLILVLEIPLSFRARLPVTSDITTYMTSQRPWTAPKTSLVNSMHPTLSTKVRMISLSRLTLVVTDFTTSYLSALAPKMQLSTVTGTTPSSQPLKISMVWRSFLPPMDSTLSSKRIQETTLERGCSFRPHSSTRRMATRSVITSCACLVASITLAWLQALLFLQPPVVEEVHTNFPVSSTFRECLPRKTPS